MQDAKRHGATVIENCNVTGIAKENKKYNVFSKTHAKEFLIYRVSLRRPC